MLFRSGSYVQAHDKPDPLNTTAARTLDGIYLQYTDSHQGGHEILHLPTNRIITRQNITELPINPGIVKQVNRLAKQENMAKGLKILTHNNTTLYDSTLLAGVDDDNSENSNSSDQEDIQENQDSDQTDEDKKSKNNQDAMDPDNIAAMTKGDIIQEEDIHLEEENDDRSNSEQKDESEETNTVEEADEDLL